MHPRRAPPGTDKRTPMIEIDGLTKHYGRHTVVDNLSFRCAAGEVLGLICQKAVLDPAPFWRVSRGIWTWLPGRVSFVSEKFISSRANG